MRVIGVIDLRGGRAVHARAGQRENYGPVESVGGIAIASGDAVALARAYVDRGITELYAADLDALMGGNSQDVLIRRIAGIGAPLWLDAGVTSVNGARNARALGAHRVIVALETLESYDALGEICAAAGGDRVAFSLDLRGGQPVVASGSSIPADEPAHVAAGRARDAGAGSVIVIDLARVGTGSGLDLALIARVREAAPGVTLLAGGGVRGSGDLAGLADAGCDGALVATALHDGRIGVSDIAAAHRHRNVSR